MISNIPLVNLITIGTSAGGITALKRLFPNLSKSLTLPIVVVLHIPEDFAIDFHMIFKDFTHYNILEVKDKMPIIDNTIYFAPPAYHVLVEKNKNFSLTQEDPVHYSRPSIDILFESASEAYGEKLCGVLLTGANNDGAEGLQMIQKRQGCTVVQDPKSAEAAYMPQSALSLIQPNFVGDITQISDFLNKLNTGGIFDEKQN